MTDGRIRQLDAATVERIAAGEVVERPASVVKELVENSLDAGASRVEVAVEAGGTEGIEVRDDGAGMTRSEVQRAVEEHTTSKIADISDLEAGVATLGFRGEALHAIGAVSRLTITTRPRDGGEATELTVEGGEVTGVGPAGRPPGTTVSVADLFYNVPARRKYLKTEATEFAHVNTVVTGYALANPDVAVSLTHDGRETFATTGQGDLREAVLRVYGGEVARAMVPVRAGEADPAALSADAAGDLPAGPLDGVWGLVSHPETTRSGREYLSTYVNGRYVRADAVRDAVVDAYGTQLAPDRYPFAVLFCALDPASVDVNVHPRKMEVRFADAAGVRDQVETAVRNALLREGLLRSGAPRGRSAPDQTEIDPQRGDDGASGDDGGSGDDGAAAEGAAGADTGSGGTADQPTASGRARSDSPASGGAGDDATTSGGTADTTTSGGTAERRSGAGRATGSDRASPDAKRSGGDRAHERSAGGADAESRFDVTEQARFGEVEETFDALPQLRVLGQFQDTYVLAATDDGLLVVDQHAADERVNYERLRAAVEGETTTQALADPVELELTAREAAAFGDVAPALERLGIRAERTGERTVAVRTLPGIVADAAGPAVVRDALSAAITEERSAAATVEAVANDLLADLACYPSITGNTSLTEGSIRDLLAALDDCENPWSCPHGRPVVIRIDEDELAERFERDYPGHADRRE